MARLDARAPGSRHLSEVRTDRHHARGQEQVPRVQGGDGPMHYELRAEPHGYPMGLARSRDGIAECIARYGQEIRTQYHLTMVYIVRHEDDGTEQVEEVRL